MFLRKPILTSTERYSEQIDRLKSEIKNADAIVIGAGAGLSTSAGFIYTGERFSSHFADFEQKYGFHDMYTGGFYPYKTPEEHWAYWSRYIYFKRRSICIDADIGSVLPDLLVQENQPLCG